MTIRPVVSLVLAAGKGTRMKSDEPKCAHPVAGVPMVELVTEALAAGTGGDVAVIVGHRGERIRKILGDLVQYAEQSEQRGTGHAVLSAAQLLDDFVGDVVVAAGDTPLLTPETIADLLAYHRSEGADLTFATAILPDPTGYGRVVRDHQNNPVAIREHKDATDAERGIHEVNTGLYVFRSERLWSTLASLKADNAQGEYYLTDAVAALAHSGGKVRVRVGENVDELLGVNDQAQLLAASTILRARTVARAIAAGAAITDPTTTFLSPLAEFGAGCRIEPGSHILGRASVGARTVIGPNTVFKDAIIGEDGAILMSYVDRAVIGDRVKVGPFANLRPGTRLADGVRIGNFVEVKNAALGPRAKANHLSYIGDASVGSESNIGAGTITCNYDGFEKHATEIGANVFVGSNSTLVAPLTIGDGAMVTAGSVVTQNVGAGDAAFGRARQENKSGWVEAWRQRRAMYRNRGSEQATFPVSEMPTEGPKPKETSS